MLVDPFENVLASEADIGLDLQVRDEAPLDVAVDRLPVNLEPSLEFPCSQNSCASGSSAERAVPCDERLRCGSLLANDGIGEYGRKFWRFAPDVGDDGPPGEHIDLLSTTREPDLIENGILSILASLDRWLNLGQQRLQLLGNA